MAEKLVNEFTVNRPIDEAWPVITDVERIAPCLPGAQLKEIEGDVYRGVVKIKLGSVTPQFSGEARYLERDNEAHRAVLKADGRDTGGRGNASAMITAEAESLSPTSTRVVVSTDLHITGKVAQFGRGVIGEVTDGIMQTFASNVEAMLTSGGPSATPAQTAGAPVGQSAEAGTWTRVDGAAAAGQSTGSGGERQVLPDNTAGDDSASLDAWSLILRPMLQRHTGTIVGVAVSTVGAYLGARAGARAGSRRAARSEPQGHRRWVLYRYY